MKNSLQAIYLLSQFVDIKSRICSSAIEIVVNRIVATKSRIQSHKFILSWPVWFCAQSEQYNVSQERSCKSNYCTNYFRFGYSFFVFSLCTPNLIPYNQESAVLWRDSEWQLVAQKTHFHYCNSNICAFHDASWQPIFNKS